MKKQEKSLLCRIGLAALLCAPAYATVQIVSMTPSHRSPQMIGTPITWTVTATDSNPGPLTFQFNVAAPGKPFALVKDFNVGTLSAGTWTAPAFAWVPTGIEGAYQIQAVIKDFQSGETVSKTVKFHVNPLVTGSTPVVVATANPLVALFSAPSCPSGSSMRVSFQQQSLSTPAMTTNWVKCHPPATMTFEIAGMYHSTPYNMFSQTNTGGTITNGPTEAFTTGALPTNIPFPTFKVNIPPGAGTDTSDGVILHGLTQPVAGTVYPNVATDLFGQILWYYYPSSSTHKDILTRPLQGGGALSIEDGTAWNPASQSAQILRQVDLAGNIIRETNTGILQQLLLAKGATDGGPCNTIPKPAPVNSACLGAFHHDAIQSLPNGYTAVITDIEKIFPAGTQNNTSGLPVDIIGDMFIVLDTNWQVAWYWDSFQHDSGAPQLDINRPAVLGDTCINGQPGCPPIFLLGSGIAPLANDWLHANSLYYWPKDQLGNIGNIIWSSRHQDWVMKIDYRNGSGTGNILWRMGPCGDFTINNLFSDPWPWFSHQHEVGIENNGAGPLTMFDNGNTRVSPPGNSTGCIPGVGSGNSRGMALTVNEALMQVTPVLSVDLGVFANGLGSIQLLSDGNYFIQPGVVVVTLSSTSSFSIEILPTPGTDTGTQVLNIQAPEAYRAWQMPNMYSPPIT